MKSADAEKHLMQLPNQLGSFLIYTSESKTFLSVRDTSNVRHYVVRKLDIGLYFITRRVLFDSLPELVEYYSKQADGLCVKLRSPCVIDGHTS